MTPSPNELTQLLVAWRNGDRQAFDRLLPLIYDELRHLAHRYMGRRFAGQRLRRSSMKPICAWSGAITSTGRIARTSSRSARR